MTFLKKTPFILILILVISGFLRLSWLGQYPAGITVDEAGQGYSAYSILKTGKDEWGDFLPLNPRGFGDYKPPVYMYLLVPAIGLFDLNEFSVRLPSAIAGILTVWLIFLLVRDLFKNRSLGLLASFFMAISPWHVYYSRLGWESNVGLAFFVLGIWSFIKGMERSAFLMLAALGFGLSGMSYHSFKLLVPLMVLSLAIIFRRQIKKTDKKSIVAACAIAGVFVLILGYGFIFSGAGRRAQDQSILKEENMSVLREMQVDDGLAQPLNRFVYNKYQFFISKVADNYLGYFSLSFLFGPHRSDGSILNFPSLGLLYIWQLPFIIIGIFYLFKNRSKGSAVLFAWTLLAPVPASLTQDYMHAGRAQALFPALTLISATGFYAFFGLLKNSRLVNALKIICIFVIGFSLLLRIDHYLFHTFNKPLGGLGQGYKEVTGFVQNIGGNYDKIIFTKANSEPHAFIAFYTKIDPPEVQNASKNWVKFEKEGLRFLDMTDYSLGKYEFRNIDISRDRNEKNALIVASSKEVPPLIRPKMEFSDLSGKVVFVVIDPNEIPE